MRSPWPGAGVVIVAAVVLGIVFRLVQYLADRSLWLDEALLALNVIHRSAGSLTSSLDYDQVAPLGFLQVEKLGSEAFGASELSLRLLPLLSGLASVPLFALLVRRILRPGPAVVATLLFACASAPIYYASEVKQYSGDIAVGIVLALLALLAMEQGASRRRRVLTAAAGAALTFLSGPSVFVVASAAVVSAARFAVRRDRDSLEAAAVTVPWLASALALILTTGVQAAHVQSGFAREAGFFPTGSSGNAQVHWVREVVSAVVRSAGYGDGPPDHYLYLPVIALAVLGFAGLSRRRPAVAALLALPLATMAVASALHKYPIFDRTVLFLVPWAIVFVAEGIGVVAALVRGRAGVAVGAVLGCTVVLAPLAHAATRVVHPVHREETRTVLEDVAARWRPGDGLFVDEPASYAIRYYRDCACAPASVRHMLAAGFVVGRIDAPSVAALRKQLDGLDNRPRVWLLYSHVPPGGYVQRLTKLWRELATDARRLDAVDATGAHAYLYDLRPRSS